MALKFKCKHCGEELIVYYLKKGEEAQCTSCHKHVKVPEIAETLDLKKPVPVPRPNLLIKQDEKRRLEQMREEIIRKPSVKAVKWMLDTVWYIGIVLIALSILGMVIGGTINVGSISGTSIELPIRIRFQEPPNLTSWEDAGNYNRADGMVLLGHNYGLYKMPGGNWPSSVVIDFLLSLIFVMSATYLLRRIFRAIIDGKPFSNQNSVDLRRVGYLIALWGPIYGTFNFFQGAYYLPYIGLANADVGVELHLYPKLIIVGMVIITISHLFKLATQIQREHELTI